MAINEDVINLGVLDGTNGFGINGVSAGDELGYAVSKAGDVNGDGIDDLILGARRSNHSGDASGSSFVVYGTEDPFNASFDLTVLDGSNGFRIDGAMADDFAGAAVSGAGDINGDGFADLLIGAPTAAFGGFGAGMAYVVYGKAEGFGAVFELSSIDGSNGFRVNSDTNGDELGWSVSGLGDFNGDGYDDLIAGAPGAYPFSLSPGSAFIVFGKETGIPATVEIDELDGFSGFRVDGTQEDDNLGVSVSSAGDVNGDGLDDLIIGASKFSFTEGFNGATYVVFGVTNWDQSSLDLTTLNGENGFRLDGAAGSDESGASVSGGGDINGDGYDDLIVSAPFADGDAFGTGTTYVLFGSAEPFSPRTNLGKLPLGSGFRLEGAAMFDASGNSVSIVGDFNGDGYDDLVIGAAEAGPNGNSSGSTYLVYGRPGGYAPVVKLADLDGHNGFRLDGVDLSGRSGYSVSGAGDINNDGFDDLVVGAPFTDSNGSDAGSGFVIFGKSSGPVNNQPTGEVIINGAAKEGELLSASNTLADSDILGEITYQWYAGSTPIEGATSDSFTPTEAEIGKSITVIVSYTDGAGTRENVYSDSTA